MNTDKLSIPKSIIDSVFSSNDELSSKDAHIFTLYMVNIFLMVACLGMWYGWQSTPTNLRVFIPPDLRAGAIVSPDQFQASQIYTFAQMYTVALNSWEEDAMVDYPARIDELEAYMTQSFLDENALIIEKRIKEANLLGVTRYATIDSEYTQYRPEFVTPLPDGTWNVSMVIEYVENDDGLEIYRTKSKYPINVVPINIDPERNIFGFALNGLSPDHQIEPFEGE